MGLSSLFKRGKKDAKPATAAPPVPSPEVVAATLKLQNAANSGNLALVTEALAEKAEVDKPDQYGWRPIEWAAYKGYDAVVEILLRHGSVIDAYSTHTETLLHNAARQGRTEVVKLLLEKGANPLLKSWGETAEEGARKTNYTRVADMIRDHIERMKPTPVKNAGRPFVV